MNLVGSEIRDRGIRVLSQASPKRRRQLDAIFKTVADEIPGDEVAQYHIKMLEVNPVRLPTLVVEPNSLIESTRIVVKAIVTAARTNQDSSHPAAGEERTAILVGSAARAAQPLPVGFRKSAFLVGLAIALDDSTLLRNSLVTGPLCRQVESDSERTERLRVLGAPSMGGRRDLAQHFVVSCGLTALVGAGTAEAVGVSKELLDARGGSGFSFADLTADLAGIAFADHIDAQGANLQTVADDFSTDRFLPQYRDLPERLSSQEFFQAYGSAHDARFSRQRATILDRIHALPAYKDSGEAPIAVLTEETL